MSELFPVKFSLEDLLDDKEADSGLCKLNFKTRDHYQDVCNRVAASIDHPSTVKVAQPDGVANPRGVLKFLYSISATYV